jgi:hypothetical protein
MSTPAQAAEVRRAKPRLDVYASLLAVALLLSLVGVAVVAMQNAAVSESSGIEAAFAPVPPSR